MSNDFAGIALETEFVLKKLIPELQKQQLTLCSMSQSKLSPAGKLKTVQVAYTVYHSLTYFTIAKSLVVRFLIWK